MRHPIYKITSVRIPAPYTLEITFDDKMTKTINFQSVLSGEMYGALRDISLFDRASIDPEVHTIK